MTVKTKEESSKVMTPAQKQEVSRVESTRPGHVFTPEVDILETESAIILLADMPGVKPDGLTIDLRENVLTINGAVRERERGREQMLLCEYETGSFYRQFRLSAAVDQSKIDAALTNGVLRLTLPKVEEARPRRIEVRSG
ncbi:MAG: Hsp20/alpha crystallin family protein [Acidobacteriota bacterium]|nr:MAG: Hsp20/alpha crystallin family protein [Acidobacteriota bacterium]